MTIGRIVDGRGFKPTGKGGGSRRGKAQRGSWPLLFKVLADALVMRAKGTEESWTADRRMLLTPMQLGDQLDVLTPGWRPFIERKMPGRMTDRLELLANRVYKMYYDGTSSRGAGHDPLTRATQSREHWRHVVPQGSPLYLLHDRVRHGEVTVINDWERMAAEGDGTTASLPW
jgi:hypothetical protein